MAESATQAKSEIVEFLGGDALTVEVAFMVGVGNEALVWRISLADDVTARFLAGTRKYATTLQNSAPIPYQVGNTPGPAEIPFVDDDATVQATIDLVTPIRLLEEFDVGSLPLSHVDGVVTRIEAEDGRALTLFRRVTSGRFLLKRSGVYRLVYRSGVFNQIDEDVVQLDDRHDCAHWDGYTLISRVDGFERLFGFDVLKEVRAEETLSILAGALPVSNSEAFVRELGSDRRYYGKLESIRRRQIHDRVQMEQLEEFCVARGIALGFEDSDLGKRVIVFETGPEWRSIYLGVMDDDHLFSELTQTQYRATSKIDWIKP